MSQGLRAHVEGLGEGHPVAHLQLGQHGAAHLVDLTLHRTLGKKIEWFKLLFEQDNKTKSHLKNLHEVWDLSGLAHDAKGIDGDGDLHVGVGL